MVIFHFEVIRGETKLVRSVTFAEYTHSVEQFTHRDMTFQSDVLNAFAGLEQIFASCFGSPFAFGIPETLLDLGLMWRPTCQLKRRIGFPSWSWAGWIGRVAYDSGFRVIRGANGKFEAYKNDELGEEGIRPLIRWHTWSHSTKRITPLNGSGLGFPYDASRGSPAGWELKPYSSDSHGMGNSRLAGGTPKYLEHLGISESAASLSLMFWASTCSFILGPLMSDASDQKWVSRGRPCRYAIWNVDKVPIGNVLFDGVTNEQDLQNEAYDFLQLSEAQDFGLENEKRDVRGFPLYTIMMIKWDKTHTSAERIGIGRIRKSAWIEAAPELRMVVLS